MEHAVLPAATEVERDKDLPLPARAQYLIAGMAAATAALLVATALAPHRFSLDWWTFGILLALVLVADRLELYVGRFYDVRVATMPLIAAALLLPAPLVLVCGLAFSLHRLDAQLLLRRRIFNGCNHALGGIAAWGVAQVLDPFTARGDGRLVAAGIAATTIYLLVIWGLLICVLHLTRYLAFAELRRQLPALLTAEGALGALGIVVGALWHDHPALVPLAVLPLMLIWTSLKIGELRQEANLDWKTGLANARHLRAALESEVDRALRYRRPLTLLVADLDFLREVNNTYGHLAGDAVLVGIGDLLREHLRSTDLAARFGGEEFVIVLPETPLPRGVQVAERIRRAVADRAFDCGRDAGAVHVTVSIGLASFPADATTAEELLDVADGALYEAKTRGRNRVAVAFDETVALPPSFRMRAPSGRVRAGVGGARSGSRAA